MAVELNASEIETLSEEIGVDKKYIKKSLELERADTRFKKYNKKKQSTKQNGTSKFSQVKNCYSFLCKQLFCRPTIPNFATVKSVESPKNMDRIILHTKTDYPKLNPDEKDIMEKSFRFHLNSDMDLDRLNYIIDAVGVKNPSELESKSIPTQPVTVSKSRRRMNKISYSLHISGDTIKDKIKYKIKRLSMRGYCIERQSKCMGKPTWGSFNYNKNVIILCLLFLSPSLLITSKVGMFAMIILFVIYFVSVLFSLSCGLYDVVSNKPEDRTYIQEKITK